MSKSSTYSTALLGLVFNNSNIANIGDATGLRGSSSAGVLYVSLHTADPGVGGNQSTNETSYTSYARVSVARTSGGWTISGNAVSPAATISFPTCTAGSAVITHVGVGTDASGTGTLLYRGQLAFPLSVSNGVTPQLTTSSVITEA